MLGASKTNLFILLLHRDESLLLFRSCQTKTHPHECDMFGLSSFPTGRAATHSGGFVLFAVKLINHGWTCPFNPATVPSPVLLLRNRLSFLEPIIYRARPCPLTTPVFQHLHCSLSTTWSRVHCITTGDSPLAPCQPNPLSSFSNAVKPSGR